MKQRGEAEIKFRKNQTLLSFYEQKRLKNLVKHKIIRENKKYYEII